MNLFECISLMHRMGTMDETTYGRALHKENLLTEADSRLKKVITIIRKYFSSVLNPEARVASEEYYVNNNPDTTWEQYILYNLRHTFDLKSNAEVALLPAVAEIAYGECRFDFEDCNNMKVNKLKGFIDLIKKDEPFLETFKKGGVTFEQLQERYGATLDDKARADQEKMDKTEYTRNANYDIIPISTMEEAYEYGKDSGINGRSGQLCFTTNKSSWETFTNHGKNKCYCILRKDYKDVLAYKGEGYPKDDYGLSMIFVFVSPRGELTNSNVRWNHGHLDFNNVDNMFTKSEISEIIGQRFNEAFNCEDGEKQFEQKVLQNGERRGAVVYYGGIYLMDGNGHLRRNEDGDLLVLDNVYDFSEGFASVRLKGKSNFIDKEGNLLSKHWFDDVGYFSEGIACVKLKGEWNFIDRDCNYLSEQWFDMTYWFREGFAVVVLNGKYNFIDRNGNYIGEQWFDNVYSFSEGFAVVKLDGEFNFIDTKGNYLSEQWFDGTYRFDEGFATVILNGEWYKIDKNGNLH